MKDAQQRALEMLGESANVNIDSDLRQILVKRKISMIKIPRRANVLIYFEFNDSCSQNN